MFGRNVDRPNNSTSLLDDDSPSPRVSMICDATYEEIHSSPDLAIGMPCPTTRGLGQPQPDPDPSPERQDSEQN